MNKTLVAETSLFTLLRHKSSLSENFGTFYVFFPEMREEKLNAQPFIPFNCCVRVQAHSPTNEYLLPPCSFLDLCTALKKEKVDT